MYSRRDFGKLAVAGATARAALGQGKKIDSVVRGVQLGAQSYSFREKPLDGVIQSMVEAGLGDCELFSPHIELRPPAGARGTDAARTAREALRQWRLTAPLDEFKAVRKKFEDAGINLCAYNLSITDDFTDEEMERGFIMAKALGVNIITASSTLTAAKRLVRPAEKHQVTVAFHGHSDVRDPNQFAKPESFMQALEMSKRFAINLDIGHFRAAGYDPLEFIRAHHDRILILHLKDRKKDQGANVPWGEGDTPIRQVLQLLRDQKYPMHALIEYEYRGEQDSLTEVKKCLRYCREALA